MRRSALLLLAMLVTASCAADGGERSAAAGTTVASATDSASASTPASAPVPAVPAGAVGERTYEVIAPTGYDGAVPLPLVVLLHGYASTGAEIEAYVGLAPLAQERGFLYVHPDGSADTQGNRFWDAGDACCNFTGVPVDDAGYLADLISEVKADHPVDPARVYLIGHSNGGFMAYRAACENAADIAAVVSIAGATSADPAACRPGAPVSVLQIHGDADTTISYTGGSFPAVYPGARQTQQIWRDYNGCREASSAPPAPIDLAADLPGPEATISISDCESGAAVDLWTIPGGGHIPELSPTFAAQVVDWLLANPRSG